jgi:tRNA G10  N-methylase Trm11
MLVNLAGLPRDAVLLDPFCGSGTVAAEALALGQRTVIASDLEERAVRETEANLAWIAERLKPPGAARVLRAPAEEIDRALVGSRVDGVATEPTLGPPLRGRERAEELRRNLDALAAVYRGALAALARLVPRGAPVVFLLPFYKDRGLALRLRDLLPAGLAPEPLLPARFAHTPGFLFGPNGGLLYGRPDTKVFREILRLRRT